MEGTYCIVTGANSGIGKETARDLAARGAHVVMACRDMGRCETAAAELTRSLAENGGSGKVSCAPLDLARPESVRAFAAAVAAELKRGKQRVLNVLVNNAGIMGTAPTPDCPDHHLATNHLGPFLLTQLLLPLMAPGSRVINVASRSHYSGKLSVKDGFVVDHPRNWYYQYARSKLANVLFTAELQRRYGPSGIISTAVSPGLVSTNLIVSLPWPLKGIASTAFSLFPSLARTPTKGAEVAIYAATSPDLNKDPALFLHDCKPKDVLAAAKDPELARLLWEASERMVCLDDPKCTSYRFQ